MKFLRNANDENYAMLGDKRVEVAKLTYTKWKSLGEAIDLIPDIMLNVMAAANKDRGSIGAYIFVAIDHAFEEVVRITAALSEVDEEYLKDNAGVSEYVEYLTKMAKKNDFAAAVKNVRSLLPKQAEQTEKA